MPQVQLPNIHLSNDPLLKANRTINDNWPLKQTGNAAKPHINYPPLLFARPV